MAAPRVEFKLPRIPALSEGTYDEWYWAVHFHLDWFGLRRFIRGTATEPAENATAQEKMAYKRKKMMAYSILLDSIGELVMEFIYDAEFDYCLYDTSYDAKRLWDIIQAVMPEEMR
ncbi:hypothetical protein C8A01DRAFT_41315 [Parachaetomium inaequale]|uniref:Uncharacterized protein n=1 Tax=Parachaetomium inaequale TaxID=2588326 RepID=A0AAN6P5Z9_9PEZI|nr:hypothetical protein C8A01DRAFT_41315 [Parachaetomium inaequale]